MEVLAIKPLKPVSPVTPALASSSEEHAIEKRVSVAHHTVSRRQGPTTPEDTPRDAMDKAEQDKDAVENAADKLNKLMGLMDKKIEFVLHDKTHRTMIKVVHSESGEVMSEFPSEKMLDLVASLSEAIGIAIDEKI